MYGGGVRTRAHGVSPSAVVVRNAKRCQGPGRWTARSREPFQSLVMFVGGMTGPPNDAGWWGWCMGGGNPYGRGPPKPSQPDMPKLKDGCSLPSLSPLEPGAEALPARCERDVRMSCTCRTSVTQTVSQGPYTYPDITTSTSALTCIRKPCIAARKPRNSSVVRRDSVPRIAARAPSAPARVTKDEWRVASVSGSDVDESKGGIDIAAGELEANDDPCTYGTPDV